MLVLAAVGFIIGLAVATTVLMSIFTRWSSRVYDDRYQKMLEIIEQNSIALAGATQAVTQFREALHEELTLLANSVQRMIESLTPWLSDFERRLEALERRLGIDEQTGD